jgi:hypothetical protein
MGWTLVGNIKGNPGTPGGSQYTHTQSSAASTWNVNHNLGYFPHITIIMDDGTIVVADIDHLNNNSAVITFPTPYTGKAVCS